MFKVKNGIAPEIMNDVFQITVNLIIISEKRQNLKLEMLELLIMGLNQYHV